MNTPSSSVHGEDLTGLSLDTVLNGADLDCDGISLSDWKGSSVVLGLELFAQVTAHHLSSKTAWSGEVSLS